MIRAIWPIAFASVTVACIGEGIDYSGTRSNCPYESQTDFYNQGFRLYHQYPNSCPWEKVVQKPVYLAEERFYEAVVTAPDSTNATTLTTAFYNHNLQYLNDDDVTFFLDVGPRLESYPEGEYTGATVPVEINEVKTDYANSYPYPGAGYATVKLTYRGSYGVIYGSANPIHEGEEFTLEAVNFSHPDFQPVTHQWFKDGAAITEPTASNRYTDRIYGSGMTVVFEVEAIDATGLSSWAKKHFYVPANCGNPPCPAQ